MNSGSRQRSRNNKGREGDEEEDDVDLELLQREYRNLQATRSESLRRQQLESTLSHTSSLARKTPTSTRRSSSSSASRRL